MLQFRYPSTVKPVRVALVEPVAYQGAVTIDDPNIYTGPWKVAIPLNRESNYQIFEYACHEGNEAVGNILRGGRAAEKP